MTMNTKVANINTPNKNWIEKLLNVLEILSLIVIIFPFANIALWIFASTFLVGDYFFFFPIAMFTFLPAGVFALFVQLFRKIIKRPLSLFRFSMLGTSIITVIIGILAWMAIYVVTG